MRRSIVGVAAAVVSATPLLLGLLSDPSSAGAGAGTPACTGSLIATFPGPTGSPTEGVIVGDPTAGFPTSRTVERAIPAGTYDVDAVAHDVGVGRDVFPQSHEQFVVELLDADGVVIATTGPTVDLPDDTTEATWAGPIGRVVLDRDATAVRATHAFGGVVGAPNSLYPVCAGLAPVPDPTTTTAPTSTTTTTPSATVPPATSVAPPVASVAPPAPPEPPPAPPTTVPTQVGGVQEGASQPVHTDGNPDGAVLGVSQRAARLRAGLSGGALDVLDPCGLDRTRVIPAEGSIDEVVISCTMTEGGLTALTVRLRRPAAAADDGPTPTVAPGGADSLAIEVATVMRLSLTFDPQDLEVMADGGVVAGRAVVEDVVPEADDAFFEFRVRPRRSGTIGGWLLVEAVEPDIDEPITDAILRSTVAIEVAAAPAPAEEAGDGPPAVATDVSGAVVDSAAASVLPTGGDGSGGPGGAVAIGLVLLAAAALGGGWWLWQRSRPAPASLAATPPLAAAAGGALIAAKRRNLDIVISYSRKDTTAVDAIQRRLEAEGYSAWMDRSDIRGGSSWRRAIFRAIKDCDVVVVVVSRHSIRSPHVTKEAVKAEKSKKHIIPVRLEDAEPEDDLEYVIDVLDRIDLFPEDTAEQGFAKLLRTLAELD